MAQTQQFTRYAKWFSRKNGWRPLVAIGRSGTLTLIAGVRERPFFGCIREWGRACTGSPVCGCGLVAWAAQHLGIADSVAAVPVLVVNLQVVRSVTSLHRIIPFDKTSELKILVRNACNFERSDRRKPTVPRISCCCTGADPLGFLSFSNGRDDLALGGASWLSYMSRDRSRFDLDQSLSHFSPNVFLQKVPPTSDEKVATCANRFKALEIGPRFARHG